MEAVARTFPCAPAAPAQRRSQSRSARRLRPATLALALSHRTLARLNRQPHKRCPPMMTRAGTIVKLTNTNYCFYKRHGFGTGELLELRGTAVKIGMKARSEERRGGDG